MTLLNITARDYTFQGIKLHNPSINEISEKIEDEEDLFFAIKVLSSSLFNLVDVQNIPQNNFSNFDILYSLLFDQQASIKMFGITKIQAIVNLLLLIFIDYKLSIGKEELILDKDKNFILLNSNNFDEFQNTCSQMFKTSFLFGESENQYNIDPNSARARKIEEMLRKGREKVARIKNEMNNKTSLIENYVMIIAVGLHQDPNSICNLTLYQILTLFNRIKMKFEWDLDVDCRLAGGDPKDSPDHWMSII